MKQSIENLNRKFELLKDKFSKNEVILVYAQLQVEELIDDIQLDKFYNILDDILSNNKERNIKLLDDTFGIVNVLSSDFNNLLVYSWSGSKVNWQI